MRDRTCGSAESPCYSDRLSADIERPNGSKPSVNPICEQQAAKQGYSHIFRYFANGKTR